MGENNLNRAKEFYRMLNPAEQRFVKHYFTHKKPSRWMFPNEIKYFPHKMDLLKGYKYFVKLTKEELKELK